MKRDFRCRGCGRTFGVPEAALAAYPGWTPRACRACLGAAKGAERTRACPAEDPDHGIFTDGSSAPNPGPGGWAVAWVEHGRLVREIWGRDPATTNNRMELTALIEAFRLLSVDAAMDVFSDSELCVKTVTLWADGWARDGWKRRGGPIANLDLVRELHALARARPGVTLRWIPAHSGWRWNEHVDALATRAREEGEAALPLER